MSVFFRDVGELTNTYWSRYPNSNRDEELGRITCYHYIISAYIVVSSDWYNEKTFVVYLPLVERIKNYNMKAKLATFFLSHYSFHVPPNLQAYDLPRLTSCYKNVNRDSPLLSTRMAFDPLPT